jgi:GntR family transcriptional repressor for pyruvate dehydrogenase complex
MPKVKLQKVEPVRIFEQAVEQIRKLIADGVFAPGDRLATEQELSRQLQVSRSSVREALRVLEAEGLIEVRRGAGAYVSAQQPLASPRGEAARWLEQRGETIEQLLQVRESVEGLTAALVTSRHTDELLAELKAIVAEQAALSQQNQSPEVINGMAILDARFHLAISSASGNDIAHEIVTHILPSFQESNKAILYVGTERMCQLVEEHQRVVAAIEADDPVQAEQAMRSHIKRVRAHVRERSQPPTLDGGASPADHILTT